MREPRIKLSDSNSFWFKLVIIVLLIAIIGAFILFFPKRSSVKESHQKPSQERKQARKQKKVDYSKLLGTSKITLLLLGMDITWTKEHLPTTKIAHSDTIMVVTIDLKRKYIGLLSIPRDLRVYLPEYDRYVKINTCTFLDGPRLLQKVIKREFNIHTDYIVVVKQEAIKELVDLIGGLDIYVEKDMRYQDRWGGFKVDLKRGFQRLNGEQVIGYMRFRMDEEGDLGRIRRQQKVIKALKEQLPKRLRSQDIPKLISVLYKYIRTDMKPQKALILARFMRDYADEIKFRSGTIPVVPIEINGISYLTIRDKEEVWETIKYVLKGYPPVQLLNGTGKPGLAKKAYKIYFKDQPFAVLSLTNAPTFDYQTTLIIYSKGKSDEAQRVMDILEFGEVQELSKYLYDRLEDPSSDLYLRDPFAWRYAKDLHMENYDVNVILGADADVLIREREH